MLKLQATDSLLVGEDTVTVTVSGSPAVTQGWFESPLDGARVSGLTPIRVIPSVTLTSGTLSYWAASASEASATVLNANTTGTGQIGTLDATVLANGSYWIKLAATNTVPVTQTNLLLVTVSGEDKPGRMMSTITDFTAPLAGLPIQIQRSYDSLERTVSGDFGYGWKLGVDALRTEVGPSNEVTLTVAGQRKTFLFTPQPSIIGGWYTPKYTAEAGLYGKLENTGDNCTGVLLRVGNTWRCGIVDGIYTPTGWKYVDPAGREFIIGADRKLKSTRDLNGNTLTIALDGVTSSAGNVRIAFLRDAQGRISKITDPLGKEYLYGYNGAGELSTVTYPSIATAAQYFYDAGHLLREYKDPRGITAATTAYDAGGRLQSVTDIDGGNLGTSNAFLWLSASTSGAVSFARCGDPNCKTTAWPPRRLSVPHQRSGPPSPDPGGTHRCRASTTARAVTRVPSYAASWSSNRSSTSTNFRYATGSSDIIRIIFARVS